MDLVVERFEPAANCYVVRAERGAEEAVVIDPGADAARLRLELARMGARCAAILVTHCDYDHIGGVADLAEGTGAPVYVPDGEADVLARPREAPRLFGIPIRAYDPDVRLEGGETIDVAGIAFDVVAVPGHTSHHVAFHHDRYLFSGDLVFAGGVGRTDLPGGDWETLLTSIRTLAERFPPDTVIYPGHGPPTTLGDELARNPFLVELRAS